MSTVQLSLPPDLEAFVDAKVAAGEYESRAAVLHEALMFLRERDQRREAELQALRQAVQVGLDELDQGLAVPLDMAEIRAEVQRRLAERQA